jgi:hypothetical protein
MRALAGALAALLCLACEPISNPRDAADSSADAALADATLADAAFVDTVFVDTAPTDAARPDIAAADSAAGHDAGPQCPIDPCAVIGALPYQDSADTSDSPLDGFDSYGCAPSTGERGREKV